MIRIIVTKSNTRIFAVGEELEITKFNSRERIYSKINRSWQWLDWAVTMWGLEYSVLNTDNHQ